MRTRVSGVAVAYCEQVRGLVARSSHITGQNNLHILFVKKSPIFSQLPVFDFDSNIGSIRQETRTTRWTEIVQRPQRPFLQPGKRMRNRRKTEEKEEEKKTTGTAKVRPWSRGENDENSDS